MSNQSTDGYMTPTDENAKKLIDYAKEFFPDLTEAEVKALDDLARGKPADFLVGDKDKDDLEKAHKWGKDRVLRADVIAWLCKDEKASKRVAHEALEIRGVRIDGGLNLDYARIPFPLELIKCRVQENMELHYANIPGLNLQGSHFDSISADGLQVNGSVFLNYGFQSEGEVRLLGAKIGGSLFCNGGNFLNKGGEAINADRLQVDGGVF